jgi:hypothetical protein
MTDAIRQFRAYLNTHDRLIQEVRPQLDPSTDRHRDADWMPIYALLSAAMAVMAEDPCTLSSEQLDRIRQTVCALDQFIAPHGG